MIKTNAHTRKQKREIQNLEYFVKKENLNIKMKSESELFVQ